MFMIFRTLKLDKSQLLHNNTRKISCHWYPNDKFNPENKFKVRMILGIVIVLKMKSRYKNKMW